MIRPERIKRWLLFLLTVEILIISSVFFLQWMKRYPAFESLGSDVFVLWTVLVCVSGLLGGLALKRFRPHFDVLFLTVSASVTLIPLLITLLLAQEIQARHDAELLRWETEIEDALLAERRKARVEELEIFEGKSDSLRKSRYYKYIGRVAIDELIQIHKIDQSHSSSVTSVAKKYKSKLENTPLFGPKRWLSIKEIEELDLQIKAVQELYSVSRDLLRVTENFEGSYESQIEQANLSEDGEIIAIAELRRLFVDLGLEDLILVRRLEVKLFGLGLNVLNLLKENWGNWYFDPRTEQIVTESEIFRSSLAEEIFFYQQVLQQLEDLGSDKNN